MNLYPFFSLSRKRMVLIHQIWQLCVCETWRYTPGNLFLESPISNPKSTNIGIIIGPIIGGSLSLIVIIYVIVYFQRKKRHGKTTKTNEHLQMMKSTHRGKWQNIWHLVNDIFTFFGHHMYFKHVEKTFWVKVW